jgi:hypothetical protein
LRALEKSIKRTFMGHMGIRSSRRRDTIRLPHSTLITPDLLRECDTSGSRQNLRINVFEK